LVCCVVDTGNDADLGSPGDVFNGDGLEAIATDDTMQFTTASLAFLEDDIEKRQPRLLESPLNILSVWPYIHKRVTRGYKWET
jgi:hypothetical protein